MKLRLVRRYKLPAYTIGKLYIDGAYFCDTLEDADRGLNDTMSFSEIARRKVYGATAIPYGTYPIDMDTISPKYAKRNAAYTRAFGHKMPRLVGVKGYEGVLIHPGNTASDTYGCILVGRNTVKGKVLQSQATWKRLMDKLLTDRNNITIEIIDH